MATDPLPPDDMPSNPEHPEGTPQRDPSDTDWLTPTEGAEIARLMSEPPAAGGSETTNAATEPNLELPPGPFFTADPSPPGDSGPLVPDSGDAGAAPAADDGLSAVVPSEVWDLPAAEEPPAPLPEPAGPTEGSDIWGLPPAVSPASPESSGTGQSIDFGGPLPDGGISSSLFGAGSPSIDPPAPSDASSGVNLFDVAHGSSDVLGGVPSPAMPLTPEAVPVQPSDVWDLTGEAADSGGPTEIAGGSSIAPTAGPPTDRTEEEIDLGGPPPLDALPSAVFKSPSSVAPPAAQIDDEAVDLATPPPVDPAAPGSGWLGMTGTNIPPARPAGDELPPAPFSFGAGLTPSSTDVLGNPPAMGGPGSDVIRGLFAAHGPESHILGGGDRTNAVPQDDLFGDDGDGPTDETPTGEEPVGDPVRSYTDGGSDVFVPAPESGNPPADAPGLVTQKQDVQQLFAELEAAADRRPLPPHMRSYPTRSADPGSDPHGPDFNELDMTQSGSNLFADPTAPDLALPGGSDLLGPPSGVDLMSPFTGPVSGKLSGPRSSIFTQDEDEEDAGAGRVDVNQIPQMGSSDEATEAFPLPGHVGPPSHIFTDVPSSPLHDMLASGIIPRPTDEDAADKGFGRVSFDIPNIPTDATGMAEASGMIDWSVPPQMDDDLPSQLRSDGAGVLDRIAGGLGLEGFQPLGGASELDLGNPGALAGVGKGDREPSDHALDLDRPPSFHDLELDGPRSNPDLDLDTFQAADDLDLDHPPTEHDIDLSGQASGSGVPRLLPATDFDIDRPASAADLSLPTGTDADEDEWVLDESPAASARRVAALNPLAGQTLDEFPIPVAPSPSTAATRPTEPASDTKMSFRGRKVGDEAAVLAADPGVGQTRKRSPVGGVLGGLLAGIAATVAVFASGLVPGTNTPAGKSGGTNPGGTTPPPQVVQAPSADDGIRLVAAGDPTKAMAAFDKTPEDAPADVRAARGQARWLARVRELAAAGTPLKADDTALKEAETDLSAAVAGADKLTAEDDKKTAVAAALHLGLLKEMTGDAEGAAKVYADAAAKFPGSKPVFDAALNRLKAMAARPVEGGNAGAKLAPGRAADLARAVVFTLVLLQAPPAADEPAAEKKDAPKEKAAAADLDEPGFLFWKAVNDGSAGRYADAIAAITEARKLHDKKRLLLVGRGGVNPLSDPLDQIFLRCCDDLKDYWSLKRDLYEHPKLGDAVKANGVARSLNDFAALSDSVKELKAAAQSYTEALTKKDAEVTKLTEDVTVAVKKARDADELLTKLGLEKDATAKDLEAAKADLTDKVKKLTAAETRAADAARKQKAADDVLAAVTAELKANGHLKNGDGPAEVQGAVKTLATTAVSADAKKAAAAVDAARKDADAARVELKKATDAAMKARADAEKATAAVNDQVAAARAEGDRKLTEVSTKLSADVAKYKSALDAAAKKSANDVTAAKTAAAAEAADRERDLRAQVATADATRDRALAEQAERYNRMMDDLRSGVRLPESAGERFAKERASKTFAEGYAFYLAGRPADAEARFEAAARDDAGDARYWYFLGLARWAQGKPTTEAFKKGADLESRGRPSADLIGAALERVQGPARQALAAYRP